MASQKALKVFEQRKSSPASYYISWAKWYVGNETSDGLTTH